MKSSFKTLEVYYNASLKAMLQEIQWIMQFDDRLDPIIKLFNRLIRYSKSYENLSEINQLIQALVRVYTDFDDDTKEYQILHDVAYALIENTSFMLHNGKEGYLRYLV